MSIYGELSAFNSEAWVTLYQVDMSKYSQPNIYLHAGTNELYGNVVFQGITYQPFPVQAEGFEMSSTSTARPTLTLANVTGIISTYLKDFDQLLGCKVTRKRTKVKYLDAVNFQGGVNPTADSTQELPPDEYYIAQKTAENKYQVQFELAPSIDLDGVTLPKRQVFSNLCPWKYRGEECGYTGGAVADEFDTPTTDINQDDCSRKVSGCKLRYGEFGVLRFGAFVGSSLIRNR